MVGQAAVIHFGHFAAFFQPFGHGLRLGALLFNTQRQGFATGEQHPGIERGEQKAGGVGVYRHLLHQLGAAAHHAAHYAAVAVDGFGGGLHGQVGAEFERLLQGGGAEAVVHGEQGAVAVGDFGQRGDVGHFVERIGRGFHKQHFGVGLHGGAPGGGVGLRHEGDFDAETGYVVLDKAQGGAEQAAAGDEMVAGGEESEQGGLDGGHACAGGDTGFAAFEQGDAAGKGGNGGVGGARVGEAGFSVGKQIGAVGGGIKHEAAGEEQGLVVFVVVGLLFGASDGEGLRMKRLGHGVFSK